MGWFNRRETTEVLRREVIKLHDKIEELEWHILVAKLLASAVDGVVTAPVGVIASVIYNRPETAGRQQYCSKTKMPLIYNLATGEYIKLANKAEQGEEE